jgi:hypothetical protein
MKHRLSEIVTLVIVAEEEGRAPEAPAVLGIPAALKPLRD